MPRLSKKKALSPLPEESDHPATTAPNKVKKQRVDSPEAELSDASSSTQDEETTQVVAEAQPNDTVPDQQVGVNENVVAATPEVQPAQPAALLGMDHGVLIGDVDAEATKITTLTRDYIVEPSITRLNRMLEYANTENNTFALRALPDYSNLQWGTGSLLPKDGNARYLCFNDKPVNVWIIGEMRGFRTKDYKFKPYIYNANRVVAGVVPFHNLDLHLARKTLGFFAMPAVYDGIPGVVQHANGDVGANNEIVWAGKWMSDYGVDPVDVPAFTNCYNATTRWVGAKNAGHMKIAPNKVGEPHVVLVEAGIKRRFVTEKTGTGYKTNYGEWGVDFELRNVALLIKAPQPEVQFPDGAVDFEV